LEVTLHNRAEEIPVAHQGLDAFVAGHALPVQLLSQLHVAIDEHLPNIIAYAYQPDQAGTIRVRFSLVSTALRVEIEDDGRPFNPLEAAKVDISRPLDEKPMGGLGVHLIRQSVDELTYARRAGRNILTMLNRVSSRPTGRLTK
jgi:anti-sigma regulatory factor (Ser/Thr protein kinase)